jgi:hypothetical protein
MIRIPTRITIETGKRSTYDYFVAKVQANEFYWLLGSPFLVETTGSVVGPNVEKYSIEMVELVEIQEPKPDAAGQ